MPRRLTARVAASRALYEHLVGVASGETRKARRAAVLRRRHLVPASSTLPTTKPTPAPAAAAGAQSIGACHCACVSHSGRSLGMGGGMSHCMLSGGNAGNSGNPSAPTCPTIFLHPSRSGSAGTCKLRNHVSGHAYGEWECGIWRRMGDETARLAFSLSGIGPPSGPPSGPPTGPPPPAARSGCAARSEASSLAPRWSPSAPKQLLS